MNDAGSSSSSPDIVIGTSEPCRWIDPPPVPLIRLTLLQALRAGTWPGTGRKVLANRPAIRVPFPWYSGISGSRHIQQPVCGIRSKQPIDWIASS